MHTPYTTRGLNLERRTPPPPAFTCLTLPFAKLEKHAPRDPFRLLWLARSDYFCHLAGREPVRTTVGLPAMACQARRHTHRMATIESCATVVALVSAELLQLCSLIGAAQEKLRKIVVARGLRNIDSTERWLSCLLCASWVLFFPRLAGQIRVLAGKSLRQPRYLRKRKHPWHPKSTETTKHTQIIARIAAKPKRFESMKEQNLIPQTRTYRYKWSVSPESRHGIGSETSGASTSKALRAKHHMKSQRKMPY